MDSSNRILLFQVVIAFDYYDGPESGLAIDAAGKGIRFSSLGDSESRTERAFEMESIDGDWTTWIDALLQLEDPSKSQRVIVPGISAPLTQLRERVSSAVVTKQFVAVGTPDLKRLHIVPITAIQSGNLRKLGCSSAGFQMASQMVNAE